MPDYFTLAEFRALPHMSDTDKYPDARIEATAAYVTAAIEREVGTSFIPRTVTGESHNGSCLVVLNSPYVQSVTSATENGIAVPDTLTAPSGILQRFATGSYTPTGWSYGVGNISVTYVAGYSTTPPADIKEAAMQWTRWRLLATNSNAEMSARQTSQTNDMGTIQYAVAGPDHPSGYPEVDVVVVGWRERIRVPSIS